MNVHAPADRNRTAKKKSSARGHQCHRRAEAGLAAHRGDAAAGLDGILHAAEAVAESLGGGIQILDHERQPPEPRLAVRGASDLEQARAEDEERLAEAVPGVAGAAVIEPGG